MNVKQIADKVAFYLQQDRATFQLNEVDMIIEAMNTARKSAEQLYDFNYNQASVWLSIDPVLGGNLNNAKLVTGNTLTETPVKVKSIETIYLQDTTNAAAWWPLRLDSKKGLAIRTKELTTSGFYNQTGLHDYPYLGDIQRYRGEIAQQVYFNGDNIFIEPAFTEARTIRLDIQRWMDDYNPNIVVATDYAASVLFLEFVPANIIADKTMLANGNVTGKDSISVTFEAEPTPIPAPTASSPIYYPYVTRASGITLDAHRVNEDATDWMTQHAHEYLFWSAICEVNVHTQRFVARTEGYTAPPERARDKALERLREWDVFLWESGRQPGAKR